MINVFFNFYSKQYHFIYIKKNFSLSKNNYVSCKEKLKRPWSIDRLINWPTQFIPQRPCTRSEVSPDPVRMTTPCHAQEQMPRDTNMVASVNLPWQKSIFFSVQNRNIKGKAPSCFGQIMEFLLSFWGPTMDALISKRKSPIDAVSFTLYSRIFMFIQEAIKETNKINTD